MKWTPWFPGTLPPDAIEALRRGGQRVPDEIHINNMYEVWIMRGIRPDGWPELIWLSIKRKDKQSIHDWRQLQRIKTELIGPENEAVELYPAESRHVDTSNQYHLFVIAQPGLKFPFGFVDRLVRAGAIQTRDAFLNKAMEKARQRPFDATHQPADDQEVPLG